MTGRSKSRKRKHQEVEEENYSDEEEVATEILPQAASKQVSLILPVNIKYLLLLVVKAILMIKKNVHIQFIKTSFLKFCVVVYFKGCCFNINILCLDTIIYVNQN